MLNQVSEVREKESLECGRMHIWTSKTPSQKRANVLASLMHVTLKTILAHPSQAGSATVPELCWLICAMNRINVPHLSNFLNRPNLDLPELKNKSLSNTGCWSWQNVVKLRNYSAFLFERRFSAKLLQIVPWHIIFDAWMQLQCSHLK